MYYKILHLPTGTYLKYRDIIYKTLLDWPFMSKRSAENLISREPIAVNYEKEIVVLASVFIMNHSVPVLIEQLEIVEVEDG
jgi:hypothetical protein